jgi:hypothetical protein
MYIEKSPVTPLVNFNEVTGNLEISGRSISEKSVDFYKPLLNWVASYSESPQSSSTLELKLEHINTYSSKCIMDIFKKLESLNRDKYKVHIIWHVNKADKEIKQLGKDYQSIIDLHMDIVESN